MEQRVRVPALLKQAGFEVEPRLERLLPVVILQRVLQLVAQLAAERL